MPKSWKKLPSCVDYQVYVCPWPPTLQEQRSDLIAAFEQFGTRKNNDICGVTTLHAPWGFIILPPVGFPELKINFYPYVSSAVVEEILACIAQLITTH